MLSISYATAWVIGCGLLAAGFVMASAIWIHVIELAEKQQQELWENESATSFHPGHNGG